MAATLEDLRHVVRTCPIIDNHAHNLLRPHQLRTSDFLTITTEASGEALLDTPKSLAHLRAAKQLRKLYDLPVDADWQTIVKKRDELLLEDADALTRKCFEGIHTVLIDDGLGNPGDFENYHWHSKFTTSPAKRIVRIEAVAASILSTLHQQGKLPEAIAVADEEACSLAWLTFVTAFEQAIISAIESEEVAGFKSVICYRTGLDVEVGRDVEVSERGLKSFRRHFLPTAEAKNFRVQSKGLCDALVISTCKLIAASASQTGKAKPVQFHTGLGDNDISIIDSNPGLLQPLIKTYPAVPIVLLHSAYPYTREAGYLATVYRNCFLDIGEVFPMVSRHGQETIIRQALELTPTSKLLWSTDGHLQAETYWLANVQGRDGLEKVIVEFVENGDLTVTDAIAAIRDIFFENSNKLYHLELEPPLRDEDIVGSESHQKDVSAAS
nr:hypothetical protein B0A51_14104 [Rachicladosporium sp. CCFEE 5018]